MTITDEAARRLWALLEAQHPNEACGVLQCDQNGVLSRVIQLTNYAPDPTLEFWMNPLDLQRVQELSTEQIALWHSHPTSRWNLSREDGHVMRTTRLPMVIVAAIPYPSVSVYEHYSNGTCRMIIRTACIKIPVEGV